jgi:ABC-type transporter Mla subunit MlaD
MAHDGKTQREVTHRLPGLAPIARPTPKASGSASADADPPPPLPPAPELSVPKADSKEPAGDAQRRAAKRRPAGPARSRIAANDDAPSIGGLIFALQQKPSKQPFVMAAGASGGWLVVGLVLAWVMLSAEGAGLNSPMMVIVLATVFLPIALFWFLALLAWRTQELKLMSSAMTEVAVRLAEPDRSAEQSAASLGQAVRRQVSFMNEAISRALGRAGELEALVHNEVSALEKSYADNEHKIKGLISELAGERHALVNTTDKVSETLKSMGSEVPALIDKLSQQQVKLAKIIESAGQNLVALETQLSTAGGVLESSLANRTQQLQAVLDDYTVALDATLANRAEALDVQLVERTRALDAAFSERLALFDESMLRSTIAIDNAVNEKARALSIAMDNHVRSLSDTLGRQANNLDDSLMTGIDAVRRTSDNITRQSLRAIEGLSSQADLLKHASENLLDQVSTVTSRFDNQGKSILRAASELESANTRIDSTLQARHAELNDTLHRLSGKAEQLGDVMRGYSATVEGSITDAENRARSLMQQLAQGTSAHAQAAVQEIEHLRAQTDAHSRAVVTEFERLRAMTDAQANRALEDMRSRVSGVSQEVSQHLDSIASRFSETSEDLRARAARTANEMQAEQGRFRAEAERLPAAARESADAMRMALGEQLRALEQLSSLSARQRRDVVPPGPLPAGAPGSLTAAYAAQAAQAQPPLPQPQLPRMGADDGEGWSLADLLHRASRDDDGTERPLVVDMEAMARGLDPTTAAAIWSRFRSGQRGIMVRSIYTAEGKTAFDDVSERYKTDMDVRRTVDRFLSNFEGMIRDLEQKYPSGRTVHEHLISDAGRVYLLLAHACGRLR